MLFAISFLHLLSKVDRNRGSTVTLVFRGPNVDVEAKAKAKAVANVAVAVGILAYLEYTYQSC